MEVSLLSPGSSIMGQKGRKQRPAVAQNQDEATLIAAILGLLRQGQRFLVCAHTRPDGDALGSMLAMGMLLDQMGKQADLITADGVPQIYRQLPGVERIQHQQKVYGHYDAVILLECDSVERSRLQGLENYPLINIDHHVSGRPFAQINWIDHEAASTGEMVFRLVRAAGAELTQAMATCLYVTVLTDTGGFCWGGIGASTFQLAKELVEAGADPVGIARDVCFSTPMAKALLLGAALGTLHREGPLAWLWVTQEDMLRTHAAEEDCEGIVNLALSIAGVEAAAFLRELPDGCVRLSLRSKGQVDVAAVAEQLGGGGHENAAGCTLSGPLDSATQMILDALLQNFTRSCL
jgi:phosphoesterase RecJ-like protein